MSIANRLTGETFTPDGAPISNKAEPDARCFYCGASIVDKFFVQWDGRDCGSVALHTLCTMQFASRLLRDSDVAALREDGHI